MIKIYVDGSCRGNGTSDAVGGIGIVGYNSQGECILKLAMRIGSAAQPTNNQAEYTALGMAIEFFFKDYLPTERVTFYSDSQLVVNQVNGLWSVKNQDLKKFHTYIKSLLEKSEDLIQIQWIPREQNKEADNLAQSITEVKNG